MKKILIAALLALLPVAALAQVVTQLPINVNARSGADLGNGPLEIIAVQGSFGLFTSQGSGVGSTSGSATLLTLTATPTTPPCVGCLISSAGITSGTTVSAYSGVSVTLSAAMTVAASTPVAWGAACPTSNYGSYTQALVQAGVGPALPMYTQARICAAGHLGAGGLLLPFAIGAH
jgi:hypothetical protein